MTAVEKLLAIAEAEVGYLEKSTNKSLDDKTANAGSNNYTKYARDLYPDLQGQAWCDMFVDWCFVQAFGKENAKILLGGGFSAYTPTSAQYYKNKKQYYTKPAVGDQIFFKNSTRICHTGIVYKVDSAKVYTIEGNTSSGTEVIANGGAVCKKSYVLTNSAIDGYGRPDYSLVKIKEEIPVGWNYDSTKDKWWYKLGDGTCPKNDWYKAYCASDKKYHWFLFDKDGWMLTGKQTFNGKEYYLCESGDLLGACMITDKAGALSVLDAD